MISQQAYSQGIIISAGGPVHRSMGGASTAAPTSAIGALYWNPATISGMEKGELEVGLDLLSTDHQVQSTFGPFEGSTDADPGVLPVPNFGWVHPILGSRWTLGLGVNSVAGFKTSLSADPTNPVLAPQPTGLGGVNSEATFLQITPVLSYAATDRLSFAAGPLITTGQLGIDPFVFDGVNADSTYSSGRAAKYHWGGGFQAGAFYTGQNGVNLGASIKSPTWMEQFEFQGKDENGLPRTLTADFDLPLIVSVGAALTSYQDWLFAVDARFIDYANTDGLGDSATFQADGSLKGLDWSSIFALSMGAQRRINERIQLRCGYTFNQNPIRNSESFYNVASPLIYQHLLSVGASYNLCRDVSINTAYSHYFENTREGPIVSPASGPVAGTSVTNRLSADVFSFGVTMRH
ncbi:OmpP1/FadL family transporter [Stieleria marina]|uniref:Outer membrane protein transport protein (OMPP1/FadL/TodX) n=1 Tax=Stieleria marina TaxID=1930275 RepID=A0A517P1Z1_9BACT|nr:Outer membrane protein transport protein (OMPP1/FadL/TodX) [Planctomycetes bacterium K23_9]